MSNTANFSKPERLPDREKGAERYQLHKLQQRVLQSVDYWVKEANRLHSTLDGEMIEVPETRFDLAGTCAGQCCFPRDGKPYLRFNLDLLSRYPVQMLQGTAPHEVAHLAARRVYGSKIQAHGKEWQSMMISLRQKPLRLHDMTTKPASGAAYPYVCKCPDKLHYLGEDQHQQVVFGAVLQCRRCKSMLSAKEVSGEPEVSCAPSVYTPADQAELRRLGYLP